MKTKKNNGFKTFFPVIIIFLLTVACEQTTITTKVSPNGSCVRTITIKSDSDTLSKDSFPIPLDDSWTFSKREAKKKETGKKEETRKKEDKKFFKEDNYIYTASKSFDRVEDLNKEFFNNPQGSADVKRFVKLEKRFRWFYTFLVYRETCKAVNPFKKIPLEEYFTAEELEIVKLLLFDKDDVPGPNREEKFEAIEKKFTTWVSKNAFEEIFSALTRAVRNAKIPGLTVDLLNARKEALFLAFSKKNIDIFGDISLEHVFQVWEEVFGNREVMKLRDLDQDTFQQLEAKFAQWDGIDIFMGYTNKVTMPGLVVGTNASSVTGGTAAWEAELPKFFFMDYEMWVESRIVNWWAVGAAALLLVLLVAALIAGTLKRRA